MKKTILTATALLCLSTPLQAKEIPSSLLASPSKVIRCYIVDAPCRIKNEIILRKEPSEYSPIVQRLPPPTENNFFENSHRYFYLRATMRNKEKVWGYFEPLNQTFNVITGDPMTESGWAPLDNAVHDIYPPSSADLAIYGGQASLEIFGPGTPVYIIEQERSFTGFPLRSGTVQNKD